MRGVVQFGVIVAAIVATGSSAFAAVTRTETFASDPGWIGVNNRVAADNSGQNFGFSNTNNAGAAAGEAGGIFYRTDYNVDPRASYYADNLGAGGMTINDTLSFSGSFNPVSGGTEVLIGFFNSNYADFVPGANYRFPNFMGFKLDGDRVRFSTITNRGNPPGSDPRDPLTGVTEQDIAIGTYNEKNTFSFTYTPGADGDSNGLPDSATIDATINGTTIPTQTLLEPGQLAEFAPFDLFGLHSKGSDSAQGPFEVYFDDLSYTAATAIPEPAGVAILGCIGLLGLRRRA